MFAAPKVLGMTIPFGNSVSLNATAEVPAALGKPAMNYEYVLSMSVTNPPNISTLYLPAWSAGKMPATTVYLTGPTSGVPAMYLRATMTGLHPMEALLSPSNSLVPGNPPGSGNIFPVP